MVQIHVSQQHFYKIQVPEKHLSHQLLALAEQQPIPVAFIGVGEGLDDLQPFDAQAFAQALFAKPELP